MAQSFLKLAREKARPTVERREWMDDAVMELVTAEMLPGVIDKCIEAGLYAADLETTGLDVRVFEGRTRDQIVGACLSHDGVHGYYAPVRHKGAGAKHNIPVSLFESELRRLFASKAKPIFHKGKFDHELLQFSGGEALAEFDDPNGWEDSLILAYLYNNKLERIGLKYLADQFFNPHVEEDRKRRKNGEKVPSYMIELWELFPDGKEGEHYDFSELDPGWEPVVWYGSGDALFTYRLFKLFHPKVVKPEEGVSQRTIYNIEKMCCTATRWMERCRVHTNQDRVAELIRLGQKELFDSIKAIYDFCEEACGRDIAPAWWHVLAKGVPFEGDKEDLPPLFNSEDAKQDYRIQIEEAKKVVEHNRKRPTWDRSETLAEVEERQNKKVTKSLSDGKTYEFPYQCDVMSARRLGPLFEEMEIPGLKRTEESKQVMTSAAELDRLTDLHGETFPFMARIKRFREVQTALSRFLLPMRDNVCPEDGTLKIDFEGWRTDTGRFSTPSDKNPKRNGGTSYMMHATPATYDPKRPECLRRLRECITARPGRILCSIDYSGEEIRIITNLSREPKWIIEHFRCSECGRTFDQGDGKNTPEAPPHFCPRCGSDKIGDIHTLSTIAFYGEDSQKDKKQFKQLRKQAKACNFALCYGGAGSAVQRSTGVDENEGWRIYRQFTATYTQLQSWIKGQHEFVKQNGYVLTAFGRRCPLPDIHMPKRDPRTGRDNGFFISKAKRNAVNAPIQGCLNSDTRIPTSLGLRRIADLQDQTFQVWTGTAWQDARAFASGKKRLCMTVFDSGRVLKTSPDHRFRVWTEEGFEWVRQEDLTPECWVACNAEAIELPEPTYESHNWKGFGIQGNSPVLWEFLGMVYGDGSLYHDGLKVYVGEANESIATDFLAEEYARAWVNKLNDALGVGATCRKKKRPENEKHKRPTWEICIYNTAFRRFCCEVLGVEDQNTWTKRFPSAVWSESISNRAAFLRGYFSADGGMSPSGDAASVRSVYLALLQDAQALLHSIGIRASYRSRCLRVFQAGQTFDFGKPHQLTKAQAIENREIPWMGQWYRLPTDLVCQIGACVRQSSVYKALPREQKSAVLRLCVGSGSKPQCLRYLKRLPPDEVPVSIWEALKYDYETPVVTEDSTTMVDMYDIEVFDDEHAFVADGVVVHNSGADILKLAMSLIYKECKKRDWLEKVYMVACMHDEIVFEIVTDIVEEALNVIMPLMIRNSAILKLKWPIPLMLDCEMGYDWMVPWNLVEYTSGKAEWPEEIKSFFPKAVAGSAAVTPDAGDPDPIAPVQLTNRAESANVRLGVVEPPPDSVPDSAPPDPAPPDSVPVSVPDFKAGDVYVHRLRKPLRQGTVESLAEVLYKCRNRGSHPIEIRSSDGEHVLWKSTDFTINPVQFAVLADYKGI